MRTAAASRVRACLRSAGMTGDVTVSEGGRRLHVAAQVVYRPVFLSAIGVSPSSVIGEASLELVDVQQGVIQ